MATKLQTMKALSEGTMTRITNTQDAWMEYLDSAAWLYKYPFRDQLLIYAQRPDARACAPIELWNTAFRRWVNKGAKGIALIDDTGDRPRLRYVFDVSDTNTRSHIPVNLWEAQTQHRRQIIEELANRFGEADASDDYSHQLLTIVQNTVFDNIADYAEILPHILDGSNLADLPQDEVMDRFVNTVYASVAYTVLTRAGINPRMVLTMSNFLSVQYFDTPMLVSQLGCATADISEMILRQMERTVRGIEREARDNIAKLLSGRDNTVDETRTAAERSDKHGTELQTERGLSDPESDDGNADNGDAGQVWSDAEAVSEGAPSGDLQRSAADGAVAAAPHGDRADGKSAGRTDDSPDGSNGGRDGALESDESDGVVAPDERDTESGGGNRDAGSDLQLISQSEQISLIEAEADNASASFVSQQDIDDELCGGSGFQSGKFRIYEFYRTQNPDTKAAVSFLKSEYGIGGHSRTYRSGLSGFVDHDGKGLAFQEWQNKQKYVISWTRVHHRIGELIKYDRYLTDKEKEHLPEFRQEQAERIARAEEAEAERKAWREAAEHMEAMRSTAQYSYALGDEAQIGATIYTIVGIYEDHVSLNNPQYPLLSDDVDRILFEQRLRESPANDHLMVAEDTPAEEATPTELRDTLEDALDPFAIPDDEPVLLGRDDDVEAEQQNITAETVAVYPAVENKLPFDIVVERLHFDAPVQETVQKPIAPPQPPAENFRITEDHLGEGGPKAKYAMNVAAIRTLQQIESEHRQATPEEQEVLSRYVGWGGVADAFDETKDHWHTEYAELRSLLTEDEYRSARESVLNAHFTSPTVIKALYAVVENMGFTTGNVLEPACGVGNFFGLVPESMENSRFYGVELDSITGRIAKQLYPKHNIAVQGFEETSLPDSFFDLAIGNVPFGDYGISDKRYDKNHFLVHDYFFAKALDKVRPGGIVAFITSSGTMDKKNPAVRQYIAQRADLVGAIRLPSNAFLANAGTGVVADILFLQKRDRPIEIEPEWVHLGKTEDGITINQYFVDNPDMVLGELTTESTQYGKLESTVRPIDGADLADQLRDAIANIHAEITEYAHDEPDADEPVDSIPADPDVRNFSYTLVDGDIFYRENSRMNKVDVSVTAANRIKGMIEIRDSARRLIAYQLEGYSDATIASEQQTLNDLYDAYTKKYGLLNSRGNDMAFSDDSSYSLLCSLEVLDENGALQRKADMFSKRTIRQQTEITHVDTPSEALAVSLSEHAKVDMSFMSELTGMDEQTLYAGLQGVIFLNPMFGYGGNGGEKYLTADEYLSGNVREKLEWAKRSAELYPEEYGSNVTALEAVQPTDLTASEIDVRLGATWIPPETIEQFMHELFQTSGWAKTQMHVQYSDYTANWIVTNKSYDRSGVAANITYGTTRASGYKILEETLNLKDIRIFDTVIGPDGKEARVLNKKETILAGQKQQLIKDAFADWIWRDPERRKDLTRLYNERFNSTRPREYDGSHLRFVGMTPEIELRQHQKDSVARVLYGGNTLLAHVVGAGKTFAATAAAMESKRLGLCSKSLFVVPNHLTEQWASEFLQLYPSANILVATRRDFEKSRRRKFCSRIATGDYDAIIIGHSQFEKIPMSLERQKAILEEQLQEIISGIADAKSQRAERFTIKQMEKSRKAIKLKLDKLNDTERKDDVITFEELGVDRLFVDEAHGFKNLAAFSKMRNVAGISQTEAQKSSDLFMKCRYMDELTGGRGIVFATGTPVSNSMVEMFTMQRYLQYGTLKRNRLLHFDSWASTFGETVTSIELAPEGTGYRARTRFARFFNLPELIAMFKEVADIKTADMLNLPVPEVEYHNIRMKPSEMQRDMVASLAERAEQVRNQMVSPEQDNMLTITNDGRKLALDQRLINPVLPDDPGSKVNACLSNVLRIWQETQLERRTQLVFCDLSTPKGDGSFSVYNDMRKKLLAQGVPDEEIAFIHEANTETKKAELFAKVRSGQVRILLGSTAKMGSGTNVQKLLCAEHHLDIPWRPADLEQREGRAIRQGNTCPKVDIYRYVTEDTFDAYMWATLENKQKFIGQIMTSKSPVRSCEDVDETALTYAEVKALATGDERIKEKMDLEVSVAKLKLIRSNYLTQKYAMEDALIKHFPQEVQKTEGKIAGYRADIERLSRQQESDDFPGMVLNGTSFAEKKDAGVAILETCKAQTSPESKQVGTYRGFDLFLSFDVFSHTFQVTLKGAMSHTVELGDDLYGNIQRLDNALKSMPQQLVKCEQQLADIHQQMETARLEVQKPFALEQELNEKSARLAELDAALNIDHGHGESAAALEDSDPSDAPAQEMESETDAPERPSIRESLEQYAEAYRPVSHAPVVNRDMEER